MVKCSDMVCIAIVWVIRTDKMKSKIQSKMTLLSVNKTVECVCKYKMNLQRLMMSTSIPHGIIDKKNTNSTH